MELALFDEVAEVVRGLVPRELGDLRCRARRYGVKVWFDTVNPPREHYEAQVLSAELLGRGGARTLALEVGFHAEHPDVTVNDAVLTHLLAAERRWRRALGPEAEAGTFLGRDDWRRVSETWPDPDLSGADVALEIGARLADYVICLEPVRRRRDRAAGGRPGRSTRATR